MATGTDTEPSLLTVLGEDGQADPELDPGLPDDLLRRMYRSMVLVRNLDARCMNLQRQGRIGFYVPSSGQEACQIGSAAALEERDWVFPTYREPGLALWRGIPLDKMICQLYGNAGDAIKGRQMPNHFSSRAAHFVSISSPIATQIPQATGCAMAMKIKGDKGVVLASMGDGGTSEGDFHVALNFAGVFAAPIVFFCQNNQWAISVPFEKQTASETIAQKAQAYGFEGMRVDGNDALAVYVALKRAVDKARSGKGPTLVEGLTYRMGPHSTSDDPRRYRDEKCVDEWAKKDPIERFKRHLQGRGLWAESFEAECQEEAKGAVNDAIESAEKLPPPDVETLFDDVFAAAPWHLEEEREALLEERRTRPPRAGH